MDVNVNFRKIKDDILFRAKPAEACIEQYRRAYKAESLAELMLVVQTRLNS